MGLEFNEGAIDKAARCGITLLWESIEAHARLRPAYYDVVCAFHVLEHITDLHSFITASIASLRPGGLLVYAVPSDDSYVALLPNCVLNMPPHHMSRWTDQALRNMSTIFPVRLKTIEHERLAARDLDVYAQTVSWLAINRLLGRRPQPLEPSMSVKVINRLARLMGRLYRCGLSDAGMLPRGFSVMVALEKNEGYDSVPSQAGH